MGLNLPSSGYIKLHHDLGAVCRKFGSCSSGGILSGWLTGKQTLVQYLKNKSEGSDFLLTECVSQMPIIYKHNSLNGWWQVFQWDQWILWVKHFTSNDRIISIFQTLIPDMKCFQVNKVTFLWDRACPEPIGSVLMRMDSYFNTLRPRQNGHNFADDIFKCIVLKENSSISIKISL